MPQGDSKFPKNPYATKKATKKKQKPKSTSKKKPQPPKKPHAIKKQQIHRALGRIIECNAKEKANQMPDAAHPSAMSSSSRLPAAPPARKKHPPKHPSKHKSPA